MKYIDEYRNKDTVLKLAAMIRRSAIRNYTFMEVCGGHTAAIHRFGIPGLLPGNIKLISGPGCPVCVTGTDFIDRSVEYSRQVNVILTVFGDLLRVPGTSSSLEKEKAAGADIRMVLSSVQALEIARLNPQKKVIFPAIGFETTAPGTAAAIKMAGKDKIDNFYLLSGHKVMPPAMAAILEGESRIDGFICPGHVAAITGSDIFRFIPESYKTACVVSGFEPVDILQTILMLVRQVNLKTPSVETQYRRAVTNHGNLIALELMSDVFQPCDALWRGFGNIVRGGLRLKPPYDHFDAEKRIPLNIVGQEENSSCICGSILRGLKTPVDCVLYANGCTPEYPVGACMVSAEGACNTSYRYNYSR